MAHVRFTVIENHPIERSPNGGTIGEVLDMMLHTMVREGKQVRKLELRLAPADYELIAMGKTTKAR